MCGIASPAVAIASKPGLAEAFYNRGIALQGLNRVDEALASYDASIALKPNNLSLIHI